MAGDKSGEVDGWWATSPDRWMHKPRRSRGPQKAPASSGLNATQSVPMGDSPRGAWEEDQREDRRAESGWGLRALAQRGGRGGWQAPARLPQLGTQTPRCKANLKLQRVTPSPAEREKRRKRLI